MILSYIVLIIYDVAWKESILIIIFIYILLFIICLKIPANVNNNETLTAFPLVSIIIPAWNEEDIIRKNIENILKSTYTNFELIVVAGGKDRTFEEAHDFAELDNRIKVIKQEPLGKSAALNKGLNYITGEIIVFLDADCSVDENWLKYLVMPIINRESNITVANFRPYVENWVSMWLSINHTYLRKVADKKGFFGGSIAFEKTIFDNGDVLNERAVSSDYYLSTQLKTKHKIKFVDKSIVITDISYTLKKFLITETRWYRNLLHTTLLLKKRRGKVIFFFLNSIYFVFGIPVWFLLSLSGKSSNIFLEIWFSWFLFSVLLNGIKPLALYRLTGNSKWLRYAWVALVFPVLLYLLSFYALITYRNVTPFFKGSRKL